MSSPRVQVPVELTVGTMTKAILLGIRQGKRSSVVISTTKVIIQIVTKWGHHTASSVLKVLAVTLAVDSRATRSYARVFL